MNRAIKLIHPETAPAPSETSPRADYLGPGRVVAIGPLQIEIRSGERVTAQLALAFPYLPAEGDVLLVIGRDEEHYVIGVLHGTGQARLSFPGAVSIEARGGPLTLSSDDVVRVQGREVHLEAGPLKMIATTVTQKFTSLVQRVRDSLQVQAGQSHTTVHDRSTMTAKNASILTEETMTINGEQIHLG